MDIIELTEATFDSEVLQSNQLVIVDFWATWCTPCRMLTPILEEIATERTDIKICTINMDEAENIAETYAVMSLPALLFFRDGELIEECIGLVSKDRIVSLLPE
ncbi:thioredoxin [Centipeda periodontii DSM 2778]|uniref:Thioredoxin n=1 Tax=Centipeda periodontii DSM 2778 TaxID=888060 RepID=F5RLN7_9FIRM|nr:thioredoxin [Centipeda periodontii]EGK60086.1 thioredoxin [Centipeda periodontii DSM 2778]